MISDDDSLLPVQRRLLNLLQSSLWGNDPDPTLFMEISSSEWQKLMDLAAVQGVFALAFDGLKSVKNKPPRHLLLQWGLGVQQIEARYQLQKDALQALASFLKEHQIQCLLLKGLGISNYYCIPEHRESGDLDIFVFGDYHKVNALMQDLGIAVDYHSKVHSSFIYHDIVVENHLSFLEIERREADQNLEVILHQLLKVETPFFSGELGVYLPPLSFNILYLFRHALKHFLVSGIVLRYLCDWALILRECNRKEQISDFYDSIAPCNFSLFADQFNSISIDFLGLPRNSIIPESNNLRLELKVLNDIFDQKRIDQLTAGGNFRILIRKKLHGASLVFRNRWKYNLINPTFFWQELSFRLIHFFDIFKNRD